MLARFSLVVLLTVLASGCHIERPTASTNSTDDPSVNDPRDPNFPDQSVVNEEDGNNPDSPSEDLTSTREQLERESNSQEEDKAIAGESAAIASKSKQPKRLQKEKPVSEQAVLDRIENECIQRIADGTFFVVAPRGSDLPPQVKESLDLGSNDANNVAASSWRFMVSKDPLDMRLRTFKKDTFRWTGLNELELDEISTSEVQEKLESMLWRLVAKLEKEKAFDATLYDRFRLGKRAGEVKYNATKQRFSVYTTVRCKSWFKIGEELPVIQKWFYMPSGIVEKWKERFPNRSMFVSRANGKLEMPSIALSKFLKADKSLSIPLNEWTLEPLDNVEGYLPVGVVLRPKMENGHAYLGFSSIHEQVDWRNVAKSSFIPKPRWTPEEELKHKVETQETYARRVIDLFPESRHLWLAPCERDFGRKSEFHVPEVYFKTEKPELADWSLGTIGKREWAVSVSESALHRSGRPFLGLAEKDHERLNLSLLVKDEFLLNDYNSSMQEIESEFHEKLEGATLTATCLMAFEVGKYSFEEERFFVTSDRPSGLIYVNFLADGKYVSTDVRALAMSPEEARKFRKHFPRDSKFYLEVSGIFRVEKWKTEYRNLLDIKEIRLLPFAKDNEVSPFSGYGTIKPYGNGSTVFCKFAPIPDSALKFYQGETLPDNVLQNESTRIRALNNPTLASEDK